MAAGPTSALSAPEKTAPDRRTAGSTLPLLLSLLPLLLLPAPVSAGGTLAFSDLLPLLKQKPELSGFLLDSYHLPDSAFARIRIGSHFQHLGGRRLGPYLFKAEGRGNAAGRTALITLCTDHRFLDRAGRLIPDSGNRYLRATAVEEELTAVVLRQESAFAAGDGCPPPAP